MNHVFGLALQTQRHRLCIRRRFSNSQLVQNDLVDTGRFLAETICLR